MIVHLLVLLEVLSSTLLYSLSLAGIPVRDIRLPYLAIEEVRDLGDFPEGVRLLEVLFPEPDLQV